MIIMKTMFMMIMTRELIHDIIRINTIKTPCSHYHVATRLFVYHSQLYFKRMWLATETDC